jgi:transposase
VFTLAAYLVSTGDPFSYCGDWVASTETYEVGTMSSQRISELLSAISLAEQVDFHRLWCEHRRETEFMALDVTSASSYSELIDMAEWGYNRDNENIPQINTCMLVGCRSRYPIYQTLYCGSLKDVKTLKTTLARFKAILGEIPIKVVMDKGFYSKTNVATMILGHIDFVSAVPFTVGLAKEQVKDNKVSIDAIKNAIIIGKDSLRATTTVSDAFGPIKVYLHTYLNPIKAASRREELYADIVATKIKAEENPKIMTTDPIFTKYLVVMCDKTMPNGHRIDIREDVVESSDQYAGWMVIASNFISDPKEAIRIYRDKDVVEKGFQRLKNNLDMHRFRVHNETNMHSKAFVGFISLILLSAIHNVMTEKNLYKQMSMKMLLKILAKLKMHTVNGIRIISPTTKEQDEIYKAFDIDSPM